MYGALVSKRVRYLLFSNFLALLCTVMFDIWDNHIMQDTYDCPFFYLKNLFFS
jgi:hypothetical protein